MSEAQQSAEQIKRKNRVQRLKRQKKVLEEKLAAAEEENEYMIEFFRKCESGGFCKLRDKRLREIVFPGEKPKYGLYTGKTPASLKPRMPTKTEASHE